MKNIKIHKDNVYKIVVLLSLFITGATIIFLYLTTKNDVLLKDNLTCHFREEVYIKDFIYKIDGKLMDNYLVDTNEVGLKDLVITYKNNYGFIIGKKITIEVKDVTSPTIVVNDSYTVEVGSITNLEDKIFCADDYDDNVSCVVTGEYDLEKVGSYNLNITATDHSNNMTTKDFILNVIEKKPTTSESKDTPIRYTRYETIYNQYKNENTKIGLDISKWQGEVDYKKLKRQDIDFVMIKVGGQTDVNGEFNLDPMFYQNIEGALENDIRVGVYFYSYATTTKEAVDQANWVIKKIKDYDVTLPIVFDWENWSNYTSFKLSFHSLNEIASSFIERVGDQGYDGMLYSSKYYLENVWYEEEYTNWLAYYTTNFYDYDNYYMWQVCSDGKIDGIDSYVDIDVMYEKDT